MRTRQARIAEPLVSPCQSARGRPVWRPPPAHRPDRVTTTLTAGRSNLRAVYRRRVLTHDLTRPGWANSARAPADGRVRPVTMKLFPPDAHRRVNVSRAHEHGRGSDRRTIRLPPSPDASQTLPPPDRPTARARANAAAPRRGRSSAAVALTAACSGALGAADAPRGPPLPPPARRAERSLRDDGPRPNRRASAPAA